MKILTETRAKLRLMMMAKGRISHVSVKEIPDVWEDFGTAGDKWINVDFPESENISACLYEGKKDSEFIPHTHEFSDEHLTVVNPEGEMEVITDKWVETVKYPNAIVIPKGVPHGVIFKNDTKVLIMWHPKFGAGWEANFINDKK